MDLKLKIRQHIDVDPVNGQQFYYVGNNPSSLVKTFGTLPSNRQWRDFGTYIDVTGGVSDLHQLTLTYSSNMDSSGQPVPGGLFAKKSASGGLIIEGEAYQLIKKWLIEDSSAPINLVDVRIEHVGCGKYDDYVIKSTDLEICDNDLCQFTITLKQKDDAFTCIQNTLITDNHQGWFPNNGRPTTKRHPRFSYCNEVKPNGILITLWWLIVNLQSALVPLVFSLALAINPIIIIIKGIIAAINAIINIVGGNPIQDKLDPIDLGDIKDVFGNFYIESAGCGREHPAPLIRDYISNVCAKCGVTVNDKTAAIFFAQSIEIETSVDRQYKRGRQWRENPYYRACYFNGIKKRGIRRIENLNIFTGGNPNNTDWWINDNAPFLTLDMFLDNLKGLLNLNWRVDNNTLYIDRKDFWIDSDYVFDFTGSDKSLIIDGICYTWTGANYPAIVKGIYSGDGADTCGNEAQSQQDGIVGLGATVDNPLFKGVLDKTTQFGAAKFRLDGASTDYVYDAMEQVIAGTTLTGQVWSTPTFQTISDYFKKYADYALLLTDEAATAPKILIWDGASYENAKCVKNLAAHPNAGTIPNINPRYNNFPSATQWNIKHEPQTKVLGRRLFTPPPTDGFYDVRGVLGANVVKQPALLVNYPMYFEPAFEGTLWDWFHWIDDPLINPQQNREFTLKIELCCDNLNRIKPFANGKDIVLGQKVKLPNKQDGKITEITISYKTSDVLGMFIEIKGVC